MVGIYLWKKVSFCHKSHLYCGAHCLKGNQHGSWDDLNFRWALGSWWGGNVNLFWSLPVLLLWYWIFIFGNYNVACPISACTILWQPYWTWSVLVLKSSDFVENLPFLLLAAKHMFMISPSSQHHDPASLPVCWVSYFQDRVKVTNFRVCWMS